MKKVALIQGGISAEREVSFKSAKAIHGALISRGYEVTCYDPKEDSINKLLDSQADVAFIALHGKNGEDGVVQGMLESLRIPYTGSSAAASALCYDKILTKSYLQSFDVLTPKFWIYNHEDSLEEFLEKMVFEKTVIVKPSREGSTFGTTIVSEKGDLKKAIEVSLEYCPDVLIEDYIQGKEITVGLLNGQALPVVEIAPKSGFFDFEAKYTKGKTEYFVPARISDDLTEKSLKISERIYQILKCSGAPRADYMISENDELYFLEMNTIPGMTETSLLPQAALNQGIDFAELCEKILKAAKLHTGVEA